LKKQDCSTLKSNEKDNLILLPFYATTLVLASEAEESKRSTLIPENVAGVKI